MPAVSVSKAFLLVFATTIMPCCLHGQVSGSSCRVFFRMERFGGKTCVDAPPAEPMSEETGGWGGLGQVSEHGL